MTNENIFDAGNRGASPRPRPGIHRACRECGTAFTPARKAGLFCSAKCRTDFMNRRSMRGSILYDFYMAHRFERDAAQAAHVLAIMNRLASDWRAEDHDRREGRRSWGNWRAYLIQNPHLRAVRIIRNIRRRLPSNAKKAPGRP